MQSLSKITCYKDCHYDNPFLELQTLLDLSALSVTNLSVEVPTDDTSYVRNTLNVVEQDDAIVISSTIRDTVKKQQ